MHIGSSDPRPSAGIEGTPPRPSVGETAPPTPRWVEVSRAQEQEGAPELPQSGGVEDPITVSDGSGGDRPPMDVCTAGEEVEAPPVMEQTPWPIGLHFVEERRKKEEEERERGSHQQLQEVLQQLQQGESLEDELEQCRQQELLELQRQQQQRSQQLEEQLELPPHGPP